MNVIVSLMAAGARKRFSKEEYRQIRKEADARYRKLVAENRDIPKALKQHTGTNIFPAIAVYKTLVRYGMEKEEATDVIRQFFVRICGIMFKPVSWYQHIGGNYHRYPAGMVKNSLRDFSPDAGFEYRMPEHKNPAVARFDIVSCPYYAMCKKYHCIELNPAFCDSDDAKYIPKTVAEMLIHQKKNQDELKEVLGEEYQDYGLVLATPYGSPLGEDSIRKRFTKLIRDHNLPQVVFHSLRHTSVTYKLKLNGGDIKAVQGDSGHAQVNMVTDVYSHIIDEDRKRNAELFEEAFYGRKNLNPKMDKASDEKAVSLPEGLGAEVLGKVLANPEMVALLTSLAKSLK